MSAFREASTKDSIPPDEGGTGATGNLREFHDLPGNVFSACR
jgi:hypothetical protein